MPCVAGECSVKWMPHLHLTYRTFTESALEVAEGFGLVFVTCHNMMPFVAAMDNYFATAGIFMHKLHTSLRNIENCKVERGLPF